MRFMCLFLIMPVLSLSLFFLVAAQASEQPVDYALPSIIAGMEITERISGEEAARIVNRMHQGEVATQANFIGHYQGSDNRATYYVSLYESPDQAEAAMVAMAAVMKQEGHGFSHLMKRTEQGTDFYMALGQDQAHYFFARDNELAWLAVDIPVAEAAVKEILTKGSET
jgi:hypothetical protein